MKMGMEPGERSERVKEYQKKLEGDPKAKLHAGMVEKLRKEVMLKCQDSFKRNQPRVRIQKLSRKQVGSGKKPKPSHPGPTQPLDGSDQLLSEAIVMTPDMDFLDSDTKVARSNSSRKERWSCRFCRRSFTQMSNKKRHERDLKGRCAKSRPVLGPRRPTPPKKRPTKVGHLKTIAGPMGRKAKKVEVFACHNCKKRFSSRSTRNRHGRKGICARKPYVCNSCPESFSSKARLSTHFTRVHLGSSIPKFDCDLCSKSFLLKKSLQTHRDSVHFGAQFSCRDCGKVYNRFSSLYNHQKLHCKGRRRGRKRETGGDQPASPVPDSVPVPKSEVDIKKEAMEPEPDLKKEHHPDRQSIQDDLAQHNFDLDPLDDLSRIIKVDY